MSGTLARPERSPGPQRAAQPDGPVRIGMIGVGRIGRMHATLVASRVAGAELVSVCDVAADAAGALAAELGTDSAPSAAELIEDPRVEAVGICSSTDSHVDLVVEAARAGKAIFCEKPVSLELTQLDRALDAVVDTGVAFQIGFNRRFDPAHESVHEAVRSGSIGDPHLIRISSRDPDPPPLEYVRASGGIFLDMTIHDFDLARYIAGSEVTEVFARGELRIEPRFADAGDVDTAVVTLIHENRCLTTIDNSRHAAYGYDQRLEVFGSLGMARSENPLDHTGVVHTAEGTLAPALPHFFLERYTPSYVREWAAFADAVRTGTRPTPGPADARAPLVIGLAARRSVELGRPVTTAEIEELAD